MIVLYVDDGEANRLVFEAALPQYEVICCASGEEALPHLERGGVEVLVADQRMPGMSGMQLLERAAAVSPSTRRMILTAYDDDDARASPLVERRFIKPFDRYALAAAIDVVSLVPANNIERACAAAASTASEVDASLERMANDAAEWARRHAA